MAAAAEVLNQSNTQTPQTPPSADSQQGGSPPATPAATGWWDTVKDPETKSWLQAKNFADPEIVYKGYRSLESMVGADKAGRTAILPKDENDAEGKKAFYAKIGVPETPEGYKLPLPEGVDDGFAKTAAQWFHKNGVPAKAAEGIASDWNNFIAEQVKAGEEADKANAQKQVDALKIEWGPAFEERSEFARRGFRAISKEAGLEDADLTKLETAIGSDKMLKMFWQMGKANAEGKFAGADGGSKFSGGVEAAQKEFDAINQDRANGKINDFQWRTEYANTGGKLDKLMAVLVNKDQAAA